MADTVRSLSALQTLLADNGSISAQDVRDMLVSTYTSNALVNLENGKATTDTPDDDFTSGTLDGKWTVVDGGSGTVDPLSTSTTGIYDLSSRSGDLLFQVNNNSVELRQDYTLPDGNSIILAMTVAMHFDSAISNNELQIGLCLNDDNSGPVAGNNVIRMAAVETDGGTYGMDAVRFAPGATNLGTDNNQTDVTQRIYLRVFRDSLTYTPSFSINGATWATMSSTTMSSACDNVWIQIGSSASIGGTLPIQAVHWIRQGNNDIDPW